MKSTTLGLNCLIFFGFMANRTEASYVINVTQVGSNVLAVGSGSLNVSSLVLLNYPGIESEAEVKADDGVLTVGPKSPVFISDYSGSTGPTEIGPGIQTKYFNYPTTSSGNIVGMSGDFSEVFLPLNYISGSDLGISTATWDISSFTSLGLSVGSYEWFMGASLSTDTFTINIIAPSVVPEPSSLLMTGMALVSIATLVASGLGQRIY